MPVADVETILVPACGVSERAQHEVAVEHDPLLPAFDVQPVPVHDAQVFVHPFPAWGVPGSP
jgi:hypothetical protein